MTLLQLTLFACIIDDIAINFNITIITAKAVSDSSLPSSGSSGMFGGGWGLGSRLGESQEFEFSPEKEGNDRERERGRERERESGREGEREKERGTKVEKEVKLFYLFSYFSRISIFRQLKKTFSSH